MGRGPNNPSSQRAAPVPEIGRRAQNKATVRDRILTAARAAFVAGGIGDADLVNIALEADVGRATLYRYFEGKDALLVALMEEDWDKQAGYFQRLVDKSVLDHATIREWLLKLIRATAARLDSFPIFYALNKQIPITRYLDRQRMRLMGILAERFEGFDATTSTARVEALLLLFQIEQFAAHAAAYSDAVEVEIGSEIIAGQLARRILPLPVRVAGSDEPPGAKRCRVARATGTSISKPARKES